MRAILLNGLMILLTTLIAVSPVLLVGQLRKVEWRALGLSAGAFFLVISAVTYVAGLMERGSVPLLRFFGLTALVLLATAGLVLTWRHRGRGASRDTSRQMVPTLVAAGVGAWVVLPAVFTLSRLGMPFGIATLFNGDIANYALVAENVAQSGFGDSLHIANADYGAFARDSYTTGTSLINFTTAMTGLSAWQVVLPVLGVSIAVCLLSLLALADVAWPGGRVAALLAAAVACSAPLMSHGAAQYYLAAAQGLAAVALVLAGTLAMSSGAIRDTRFGMASVSVGGALGIYAYGHIGLPLLIFVPVWVGVLCALRAPPEGRSRAAIRGVGSSLLGVALALAVAAPAVPAAFRLVGAQRSADVGYALNPLSSLGALLWPSWIVPEWVPAALNPLAIGASWLALMLGLLGAVSLGGRHQGGESAKGLVILILLVFCVGAMAVGIWGSGAYQTWKLWALCLPLVVAATLPAVSRVRIRGRNAGEAVVWMLAGAAFASPMAVWGAIVWAPTINNVSTPELLAATREIEATGVSAVNIDLEPYLETMVAGAMLEGTRVAFSSGSYLGEPVVLAETCTLTTRGRVPAGVTAAGLDGDYVLVPLPAACQMG